MKIPNLYIALPALVISLAIFYIGRNYVADELIRANHQVTTLQLDLEEAVRQLQTEQAKVAVVEREADVLRRANALLRESEREHQDEIANLQADLAFYRRLGGASGSQAPLAVHYLELLNTQSPRVFQLVFTLTQNLRWAAVISGRVHLGVDGIQDGVAARLTEEQLLPESAQTVQFRFKYFQQIERLITLPVGFEPSRLTIRLQSRGLQTPVEQSMDWQDLFNRSGSGLPAKDTKPTQPGN
ncbi:MAG: hypothetical protein OQJ84_06205 [Xanthomonadales bacterium]|nr:hypothetical protein [Xanthomonadales bacterium]